MLKLSSVSASRIKTFDACKFKYWLTYCCPDVTLKSNWGAAHGDLIHNVLEHYSNKEDIDWVKRLFKGYGGQLSGINRATKELEQTPSPLIWAKPQEYKDKKPLCDTCPYAEDDFCSISLDPLDELKGCPRDLFDGSIAMIEKVMARYEAIWPKVLKDKEGKEIGFEYGYNIPVSGTEVPMIGFIDLILEEDPETIHVIDYKAGKHTQSYADCRDDIQVKMYSLACRREFIDDIHKKGYQYKNVMLTFDYFRGQPVTIAFSKEEDAETEVFLLNKIKQIQTTEWIDRIVRNNEELDTKTRFGQVAFNCKYLCDSDVCKANWKGRFKTEGCTV